MAGQAKPVLVSFKGALPIVTIVWKAVKLFEPVKNPQNGPDLLKKEKKVSEYIETIYFCLGKDSTR